MVKVLVACEFSGVVREAFHKKGFDAVSCDLLPTEQPGKHIQGDVIPLLKESWDLIIAHPPCTHLSCSGARYFKEKRADGRQQQGVAFFLEFVYLACPHVCIENPVGVMSTYYRKPDQIIHPWQFGHEEEKTTCLWLKGLPKLIPTQVMGRRVNRLHALSPSPTRWKERSRTYQGIADAMADQWEVLIW
jgi:site-specific DNA-cytosine methylase